MKEQLIYLEPHDDVTSVRDKLGWVRAARTLLIFPDDPRQRILQSKLELLLVQREATRVRTQLALITRDPVVIENARELGIACFRSIEASRKHYWHTEMARLKVQRTELAQPLDPGLVEAASRLQPAPTETHWHMNRVAAVLLVGIVAVTLLAGIYVILPGATIYLTPASNQVTALTTVIADPAATQVDVSNGIIPARIVGVEVQGSATIDTTGTRQQPSEKARGVALFTNLIPEQVTIPTGTVVRTSAAEPVRFVTLVDATLAGEVGATVEVPVEAVEAGFGGNLPSNRINQIEGVLSTRLAVTNPTPTRGGDEIEVRAVSQEDHDRVRALVLQQLQQRAYAEMQTDPYIALLETEFVPIESLSVVLIQDEIYSGYVGQAAEQVNLTMRATVQGVAINELFARQVVYARLAEKVGPGYQIGPASLVFRRGEATQIDEQRRVTLIMQGAGDVLAAIEPAQVQQMVRGLTVQEAALRLNRELPLAVPPVIQTWPSFWPFMPVLPLRIQVEVQS